MRTKPHMQPPQRASPYTREAMSRTATRPHQDLSTTTAITSSPSPSRDWMGTLGKRSTSKSYSTQTPSSLGCATTATRCYDSGLGLFFYYLSLTSSRLIRAASSFFHMTSFLHHYDDVLIPDSLITTDSCTRMISSYIMRRQLASLVCP